MELGFLIVLAAVFFAAFVQRLAGFGYGLISAPVAMIFFSPLEVAFLMAFWGTVNSAPTAYFTRRSIPWGAFWPVIPWLMVGLVAGLGALFIAPPLAFKILAVLICVQAFISVFWPHLATRGVGWTADGRVAGTLAGLLQATVNIPGPPLVVHFNTLRLPQEAFVGVFAIVFLSVSVVRVILGCVAFALGQELAFLANAIPASPVYTLSLGSVATFVGVTVGQTIVHRVSTAFFKRLTGVMIAVSALALLTDILGLLPNAG
ncbi:MAG: hypothetical protein CMF26_00350 [Kiloniella sp.]|nr:hypothetical protein [Kiloniella sp.]